MQQLIAPGGWRAAAVCVIPIVFVALAQFMRADRGPYFVANSDPDYAYLTNALNVVILQPPDLYEHPGLTTEVLGAVGIVVRWLIDRLASGDQNVTEAVLARPEVYLGAISNLFAVLIAVAALIAGFQTLRSRRSVTLALAVQASPMLFVQVPAALPRVTPEPVLIIAGLLLVAVLIPIIDDVAARDSGRSFALAVGGVLGFGLATKFTFLPLLAFVALVPGRAGKLWALVACGLSFIVFTLPVAIYYKYMLGWLRDLVIHTGANGGGEIGVLSPASVLANIGSLYAVAPTLFVLAVLCLIAAIAIFREILPVARVERSALGTVLLVSSIAFGGQIVMTAKQPSGHYLMPSLTVSGLAVAALLIVADRAARSANRRQFVRFGVAAAVVLGLTYATVQNAEYARTVSSYADDVARLERQIDASTARIIDYYGSGRVEYALSFGNDFARKRYGTALEKLYPDALFYSIWERRFYSFAGDIPASEVRRRIRAGQGFLIYGYSLTDGYAQYRVGLTIDPIALRSGKAVYRLVDVDDTQLSRR